MICLTSGVVNRAVERSLFRAKRSQARSRLLPTSPFLDNFPFADQPGVGRI